MVGMANGSEIAVKTVVEAAGRVEMAAAPAMKATAERWEERLTSLIPG
jgi:hypothetical protein